MTPRTKHSDEHEEDALLNDATGQQPAEKPAQNTYLAARYGTKKRRRTDRIIAITGAAVIAGLIGYAFIGGGIFSHKSDIDYRDIAHSIETDHTATLKFELTVATGHPVSCAIEALGSAKESLGFTVLEIPPSQERTRLITHNLRTLSRASTITVKSCQITTQPGQN
ncbi:MAG: DUF4307 domain-containing protein [Microbacteriaceae bacterium]|nr:DUF4307 domain-containing protein [Microbacteriaceae bacterium]